MKALEDTYMHPLTEKEKTLVCGAKSICTCIGGQEPISHIIFKENTCSNICCSPEADGRSWIEEPLINIAPHGTDGAAHVDPTQRRTGSCPNELLINFRYVVVGALAAVAMVAGITRSMR